MFKMNHLEKRYVQVGPTGPIGEKGPVGHTGHIGYRGHTGYKGHTGCTGPTGVSGKDGNKGDIGPKGNDGAGMFNFVSSYPDIEFPASNSILKTNNNYIPSIVTTVEKYRVLVFTFEAPVNASNTIIGLNRMNPSLFCHSVQFLSKTMNIILNGNDTVYEKQLNNLTYSSGDMFSFIVEETKLTVTNNGIVLYEGKNYYPTDFFKAAFRISTVGQLIKNISFGYVSTGLTGPSGVAQTGTMVYYVGSDNPSGWLRCDGRSIAEYTSLCSLLQATTLPNMPQIKDISNNSVVGSYIMKY